MGLTGALEKRKQLRRLERFEAQLAEQPKDPQLWLRAAEAAVAAQLPDRALASYRVAAALFRESGSWARAEAVLKSALRVAPADKGLQKDLADVSSQRRLVRPGYTPPVLREVSSELEPAALLRAASRVPPRALEPAATLLACDPPLAALEPAAALLAPELSSAVVFDERVEHHVPFDQLAHAPEEPTPVSQLVPELSPPTQPLSAADRGDFCPGLEDVALGGPSAPTRVFLATPTLYEDLEVEGHAEPTAPFAVPLGEDVARTEVIQLTQVVEPLGDADSATQVVDLNALTELAHARLEEASGGFQLETELPSGFGAADVPEELTAELILPPAEPVPPVRARRIIHVRRRTA